MKTPEVIRRHPKTTAAIAAFLLGISGLELAGQLENQTYSVPADSCVSPIAASGTYVDSSTNILLQTDTGFFTTGALAEGTLPKGAYGVEGSFESPGAGQQVWNKNTSSLLKADSAGQYALKFAIGSGEVQFGVRVVAPEGSPLCDTPPDVTFTHEGVNDYFTAAAQLPWPNIINAPLDIHW